MNEKQLLELSNAEKCKVMIQILNKQINFQCEASQLKFGTNQYNLFN